MRSASPRRRTSTFVVLLGALLLLALTPVVAGAVETSVAGYVVDSEGTPLGGIEVSVEDGFGNVLNFGTTLGDGTYLIGGIEQYSGVVVKASDPFGLYYTLDSYVDQTLTPGEVNAGRDFTFGEAGRAAGRVVDDVGTGIPGIAVCALGTDDLGEEAVLYSTTTDLNGDYTLGGVEPGPHWVAFRDDGTPQTYVSEYYNDEQYFMYADAAQFATGTPTALNDAVLQAYGWVQGTVLDASSTPVAVSSVEAYRYNPAPWSEQWEYVTAVQVDEYGNYTAALLPGTYRLRAREDNNTYVHEYYPDSVTLEGASDITVSAKTTIGDYNFVLEQAGHITGTVTPRAGGQLSQPVYAEAFRKTEDGSLVSVTVGEHPTEVNSETGVYDVPVNFTGDVYLSFTSNTYANVWYPGVPYSSEAASLAASVGGTLSDVNQIVDLKGTIAGKVTNSSGIGVEGVTVEVYDARTGKDLGTQFDATTIAGGTYVVEGLDLAEHKLRFWDDARRFVPEWYDNVATEASATTVALTWDARNKTGINASLAPAGKISGTITSKTTGKPLSGIKVTASEIDPNDGWAGDTFVAYTDSSGNYSMLGAFTGYVKVWAEDTRYVSRWYSDKPDQETATLIPTTAGSTVHGIDIVMQPGASIAGSIKDGLGSPIFDSGVVVYRKVGSEWQWTQQAFSDGGLYKAESLEAGTYALWVWSDGFVGEYYDNARSITSATPIALSAAQAKSGVNAVLGRGGKIAGTVTGSALEPKVEAIDVETGLQYSGWVDDSEYAIETLPPGQYKLVFFDRPDAGDPLAAPEFYNDAVEYSEAETLTVTEGGTLSNIDAELSGERSSISGTFTSGGADVAGWVSVVRADVDPNAEYYYWRETKADSRGSFEIDNLRPGDYKLYFYPDDPDYFPFYYPGVVAPSLATTFTVEGAFSSSFDVVEKGTLDLSIKGVGGAGIGPRRGNIRLWYDAGEAGWLEVTSGYASGVQGYSGFDSLFPGSYKIQFVDVFGGYRNTYYGGSTLDSATAVDVGGVTIGSLGGIAPPPPPAPGPIVIPLSHLGTAKTRVTLSASTKTPSYGYSSSLVGQVSDVNGWPFADKSVKLYSATKSSGPWTYRATLKTGSNGRTSAVSVKPGVLTYYRLSYTGPDSVTKTATVAVKPKAYLSLSAPTTAKRNTAFSFSGALKPKHTAGSTVAKIYAYRYVGGTWKYTKYAYGKAYNYSSYSKYSGKISLPYAGKWKLVAVHSDTGHTSTSSSARYVTVK